ncbi:DMT family transporter [bacterium]|nr:DMT family transporter [candidate division CSSED10-310 bacterium]
MTDAMMGKTLATLSALTWAVAVLFFKQSGETIRPVALNFYKSTVAALCFVPVMVFAGVPILPHGAEWVDFWMLAASGVIGITIADSLFFRSLNLLGAGLTAIVDCLYSPLLILLSYIFLNETLSVPKIGGAVLVGMAILVAALKRREHQVRRKNIIWGMIVGSFSMFMIAAGVVLMQPTLIRLSENAFDTLIWVIELRLVAAAIGLAIQIALHPERKKLYKSTVSRNTWRLALPATFLGNILAMLFWVAGFQYTDVSTAAVLNQTNTIFLVILATLFLKEPFTMRKMIAITLGFAGAVLVSIG